MKRLLMLALMAGMLTGCNADETVNYNGVYYCTSDAKVPLSDYYPDTFSIHNNGSVLTDDTGESFKLDMSANTDSQDSHLNYVRMTKGAPARSDAITVSHVHWNPMQKLYGYFTGKKRNEWTAYFDINIDQTIKGNAYCMKVSS
ncbi:hypothetical protein I4B36_004202 [Enterobacter hormaechei]|nr:hypothetical protein [Enterobacter hormaechei]